MCEDVYRSVQVGASATVLPSCECPRCEAAFSPRAAVLLPPSRCRCFHVGVTSLVLGVRGLGTFSQGPSGHRLPCPNNLYLLFCL